MVGTDKLRQILKVTVSSERLALYSAQSKLTIESQCNKKPPKKNLKTVKLMHISVLKAANSVHKLKQISPTSLVFQPVKNILK